KIAMPRPVDQHRRTGGTGKERKNGTQPGQHEQHVTEHEIVGYRGNESAHVRRVLVNGEKAARCDVTGDQRKKTAELLVGARRPMTSGQATHEIQWHILPFYTIRAERKNTPDTSRNQHMRAAQEGNYLSENCSIRST